MKKLINLLGLFVFTNLTLVSATESVSNAQTTETSIIIILVAIATVMTVLIVKNNPKVISKKKPIKTVKKKDVLNAKKQGEVIPTLIDYISKAKDKGLSDSTIRKNLLDVRWPEEDINKTLEEINKL